MSDSTQFGYPFLWDQILKWVVVLQRPAVQGQLLAIAIAVLAAKLISKWVWKKFRRRFNPTNYSYRQGRKRSWKEYGALLLHLSFTPLLSILVINAMCNFNFNEFTLFQPLGGFFSVILA